MGAVESLTYPKKSHRKQINFPGHSVELAEFFGVMIGDGEINNPWQARITLNSVADLEYSNFVASLGKKLFHIMPAIQKRKNQQALSIYFASVSLIDFLVSKGLPRGNKLQAGLCIPGWILNVPEYRIACMRGLMDTDGCLFIHRHSVSGKTYNNIGLCFSSHSPKLIEQVGRIFEEFSIIPHISNHGRSIYLYKESAVVRYLDIFGTSNSRITKVHQEWKRGRVVEGARLESV
jgi:hypothetical protein